jgi:hypothetical protein
MLFYSMVALSCTWTLSASAQIQIPDSVRKSKPLADLRTCNNALLENGKKANFEASRDGAMTLVLHPTPEPLLPLAAEVVKCLDEALPKKQTLVQKGSNLPHHVWSAEVDGFAIFCATPVGPNTKDYVSPLGGAGPKRAWYGISFTCRIGKEISVN